MNPSKRPRRFILIPRSAAAVWVSAAKRSKAAGHKPVPRAGLSEPVKVVNRSPADGALLIEPQDRQTLDQLKAQAPAGTQVIEEQWYRLERPARPWSTQGATLKKPRTRAGHTLNWTVVVTRGDAPGRRLPDALVTVMVDEDRGIGVEGTTDRYGKVSFVLGASTRHLDAVYVDPLHSGWPVRLAPVAVEPAGIGIEIAVPPIDAGFVDARGTAYGKPSTGAGKAVHVAVVDTGVGPHDALKVHRGRNTTTHESGQRFRDEQGHGSHVAGVIASVASAWRRGEASAVALHAYRIFEAGDSYASSFAIAAAIKDAADQGCDLVNLSIGDSLADEGIRGAVTFAWERGCVCVAATGNDGKGQVDYPARYPQAVAVSAVGLVGSWPASAYLDWTLGPARGKPLGGRQVFLAGFSNRGKKVALTAPGVGIVSTIFGNRWGVMSGTSMATPIATGVLARRLAVTPSVLQLPRDAARSAAIVKLALEAAEDLDLPAGMQGHGLAR